MEVQYLFEQKSTGSNLHQIEGKSRKFLGFRR